MYIMSKRKAAILDSSAVATSGFNGGDEVAAVVMVDAVCWGCTGKCSLEGYR